MTINHRAIHIGLSAAALVCLTAIFSTDANAAACDANKSKFMWRRCMSSEIDKLTDAINEKALDLCNSRTNSAEGPAAVDARLACRLEKLSQTLQQMN